MSTIEIIPPDVDPVDSFYPSREDVGPDTLVNEMDATPHLSVVPDLAYDPPGIGLAVSDRPEARKHGDDGSMDERHLRGLGAPTLTLVPSIETLAVPLRDDEWIERRMELEIEAQTQAAYEESLRAGKRPDPTSAFEKYEPQLVTGSLIDDELYDAQLPPVINGRQLTGEQWEVYANSQRQSEFEKQMKERHWP